MSSPLAALRGIRAAFVFLSRLPLGGYPYAPADYRWAPAHFPLVGSAVGALSAGAFWLCHPLGAPLAAVLAVAASVWLTGAFHEDGLADSADGLGGAHGGKPALEIMKDSRIGTYGATALGLSLLIRSAAIGSLRPEEAFAIVAVHCSARVGPVWLLATAPYVSSGSNAKGAIVVGAGIPQALVASGWALVTLWLGVAFAGLPLRAALGAAGVLALLTPLWGRYCKQRVGGVNGDLLGALEQLGEIAGWISLRALCSL